MSKFIMFLNQGNGNQQGFVFPFFLFLVTLSLLVMSGSIAVYQNNIITTSFQEEQLKIETLFQTGAKQFFREEVADLNPPGQTVYTYPHGTVTIQYTVSEDLLRLNYLVQTNKSAKYRTTKWLELEDF